MQTCWGRPEQSIRRRRHLQIIPRWRLQEETLVSPANRHMSRRLRITGKALCRKLVSPIHNGGLDRQYDVGLHGIRRHQNLDAV